VFLAKASWTAEPDIRRDETVAAVERVMPCVVNIATESVVEYEDFYQRLFRDFFGQRVPGGQQQREFSVGSGVIIDEDGYVLTNWHVVRRAARTQVKLWDGREYDAIPLVATTKSDVALLQIQKKPGEKFKAVKMAADDDLMLGETVLALGNPFGLGGSVSKGILSSKSRRPATGDEPLDVNDWLQTDAAINPGNSGGPLVNIRGDLIGLNVAVYREGHGIGFAIPIRHVSEALSGFFSPEVRHQLWVGAELKAKSGTLSIAAVQPNSPASKAGFRIDDRVVQVNGQAVTNLIQYAELVGKSGESKANVVVQRGGARQTISVRPVQFTKMIEQKSGLKLTELNNQQVQRLGLQGTRALLVEDVEKGSPAEQAEIHSGFLLTQINGEALDSIVNAGIAFSSQPEGQMLRLTFLLPRPVGRGLVDFRQGSVNIRLRGWEVSR